MVETVDEQPNGSGAGSGDFTALRFEWARGGAPPTAMAIASGEGTGSDTADAVAQEPTTAPDPLAASGVDSALGAWPNRMHCMSLCPTE